MDGTSMAAPHVSGAAALLMARHRELVRQPAEIKRVLRESATDLGREPHYQGHGMLDILRANPVGVAMTQPALSLEVLRAEHGDCLLLHHGNDIVLIDGGPSGVYKATLKPRLQELMATLPRPLFLQMVMVSHIDDDHIVGLADMFAEAVDRKENKLGPPEWAAGEPWLNTVRGAHRGEPDGRRWRRQGRRAQ